MNHRNSAKRALKKSAKLLWRHGKKIPYVGATGNRVKASLVNFVNRDNRELYELAKYYPTIEQYYVQQNTKFKAEPLISILLPTYNTPEAFLKECMDSILMQSYANWELCIADDSSTDPAVVRTIEKYQKDDKRIRLVKRKTNGHISLASNSALEIAKGEYIALMDHDDVLWPNALFEMVSAINREPDVDLIYSDEDKIDGEGTTHSYPFLKPKFSPEFLESCNYITHFSCIRRSMMTQVGGFRKGLEGAQDWDLFIRIGEQTDKITHLPKILYSWRIHEASTASDTDAKPYVYTAQLKLLEDHISRQGKSGEVTTGIIKQHRTVRYSSADNEILSVIVNIPNDQDRQRTISSLASAASGANFEVIVVTPVGHGNENEEINGLSILRAKDMIVAKKIAQGDTLLIVNDAVEMVSEDWARLSLADTAIDGVGIVYPVVLTKDKHTVLSAGVGVGYGNGATHMLEGMPLEDNHYTRGLYGKSRRNVSAGSIACFAVSKDNYEHYLRKSDEHSFTDDNLAMLEAGLRHVYSPYIQVTATQLAVPIGSIKHEDYVDEYLNPNFDKSNGRMEVSR